MSIAVTLINETSESVYLCLTQKPEATAEDEVYSTLFPAAWKVVPLAPDSLATVTYRGPSQVMCCESRPQFDAHGRVIFHDTEIGDIWRFVVDGPFSRFEHVGHESRNGVTVVNGVHELVDVVLASDGNALIARRGLAPEQMAILVPEPVLYAFQARDLGEGDLIKSDTPMVGGHALDLVGLASVTLALTEDATGAQRWEERDRRMT